MNNKITTIFFDLGNTLIHYHRGKLTDDEKDFLGVQKMYERLKEIDDSLSFTKLYEEFYIKWSNQLKDRKFQKTEYNAVNFMLSALNEKARNRITDSQLKEVFKSFHEPTLRFAEHEDSLKNTLEILSSQNFNLYIISNSPIPGYCHDEVLQNFGLIKHFEKRFYSYDLDFKKPSKKMFDYAIQQTNSKFEESVFVGDSLELDIIPSLKCNMKAVFLNNNNIDIPNAVNENKNFGGIIKRLSYLPEKLLGTSKNLSF